MSNTAKSEIRAEIQLLLGDSLDYPHLIMSNEIAYIGSLDGMYRELAIYQAALGQLVAKNTSPDKQERFRKHINVISDLIQKEQIYAVNAQKAWSDKYGDLHYIKKGDKTNVSVDWLGEGDEPSLWLECTLCADGKITPANGKWYPCECPLGDKWSKNTGYMGPATSVTDKPKSTVGSTLKTYYDKKLLDTLKKNTKMDSLLPKITPAVQSPMTYQDYVSVANVAIGTTTVTTTEGMQLNPVNLVPGALYGKPVKPYVPEPDPIKVQETETPVGRKFRKDL